MLIEYEKAHVMLLPYYDSLWNIISGGWDDWNDDDKMPARTRAIATPRTRASYVHDFMRYRAVKLAGENQTVTIVVRKQMFVLVFKPHGHSGCIGIRLKKFNEEGLSRNQPTTQVREFRNQLRLPEVEADFHLEAGYVIDGLGMELISVDLVCPSGNGTYWMSEILPHRTTQNIQNLFPDDSAQNMPKEVLVRKKAGSGKNHEATG